MMKNNFTSKLIRTLTSVLPVDKSREGTCNGCGDCCKIPNKCVFLVENEKGEGHCSIYSFRPLVCRKYPRTENENVTPENCSYTFVNRAKQAEEDKAAAEAAEPEQSTPSE